MITTLPRLLTALLIWKAHMKLALIIAVCLAVVPFDCVVFARESILSSSTDAVHVCQFDCAARDGTMRAVIGVFSVGLAPRKLTASELPEKWPVVSPNGSEIAFFRAGTMGVRSTGGVVPRKWDLYLVDRHGDNERRITNMEFGDCCGMDFSPDGSNIVFSVMRNEYPVDSYFELRIISAVSIAQDAKRFVGGRVLLHDEKHNILPVISRDSRWVLYVAKSRRRGTFLEVINPLKGTVFFRWELCILDMTTGKTKVLDVSAVPINGHCFSSDMEQVFCRKNGQPLTIDISMYRP